MRRPSRISSSIFVLRPAVAAGAERHFLPLSGLVIVADFGEFLAVPHRLYALVEHVADIGALEAVEAADRHRAVIMHRQRLIQSRARQALLRRLHIREGAVLEQQVDAHAIDQAAPALDKGRLLVAVLVLQRERHADPRQIAIAARRQHAEHRRLDFFQFVDAADLLRAWLARHRI